MPAIALGRHGTGMPNSDVRELVTQHNQSQYWTLNAAIALSGVTYSASAFQVLASGSMRNYTASTGAGFTGLNITTGNFALVAAYVTSTGGTHGVSMGVSAASLGALTLPTGVPTTAYVYGFIIVGTAAAASGFTGGTTVLDGTNASARFFNLNGPAGMAVQTASIVVAPG